MTIKCYIIEDSSACAAALKRIENAIPCFTQLELTADGYIEYTIRCRLEDVITVERMLAHFV